MATALEMIKRLGGISMLKEAEDAFNDNHETAEDLNRQQLDKGQTGSGDFLPDYSYNSVHKYGKRPGPIRLFDTGAFWKGIKYGAEGTSIESYSTDSKFAMLTDKYGEDVLGLTSQSKSFMGQVMQADIVISISEQTGMKSLK